MTIDYNKIIKPYVEKIANTCSYCDKLDDLVLLEWKYSYITIAIWQYMEGYVQICSKKHRPSVAWLEKYEAKEFYQMKNVLKKAFKECYNKNMICFEHWQAWSCHWWKDYDKNEKTLCYHAHLHCLPCDVDIRSDIKEILSEEIIVNSFEDLKYIRDMVIVRDAYLFFEDKMWIWYLYPVEDESVIPRQFLRKCVAKQLWMLEKADWVKYPWIDFFDKTKSELKPILNRYFLK
jgi:hypothetical protein